tara:strand:- start:22 stop:213 length:192 start_codon:yes stop_codon:yes gene_type:complete
MDKKEKIELDTRILAKNLEITKLKQQIDNLTSELVELKETHKLAIEDIKELREIIDVKDWAIK